MQNKQVMQYAHYFIIKILSDLWDMCIFYSKLIHFIDLSWLRKISYHRGTTYFNCNIKVLQLILFFYNNPINVIAQLIYEEPGWWILQIKINPLVLSTKTLVLIGAIYFHYTQSNVPLSLHYWLHYLSNYRRLYF